MRIGGHLLAGAGLIAIGALAMRSPRSSSAQFGLPVEDRAALGFVRGCGARDIALGVLTIAAGPKRRLPLYIAAFVGLSDLLTVATGGEEPQVKSLLTHGIGTGGAVILALLTRP